MGILMLNSENYSSSVGGGSNVIPNPEGTPTDTLTTIQINGVIYSLPQGGGGGSVTRVFHATNRVTSQSTITVTEEE